MEGPCLATWTLIAEFGWTVVRWLARAELSSLQAPSRSAQYHDRRLRFATSSERLLKPTMADQLW